MQATVSVAIVMSLVAQQPAASPARVREPNEQTSSGGPDETQKQRFRQLHQRADNHIKSANFESAIKVMDVLLHEMAGYLVPHTSASLNLSLVYIDAYHATAEPMHLGKARALLQRIRTLLNDNPSEFEPHAAELARRFREVELKLDAAQAHAAEQLQPAQAPPAIPQVTLDSPSSLRGPALISSGVLLVAGSIAGVVYVSTVGKRERQQAEETLVALRLETAKNQYRPTTLESSISENEHFLNQQLPRLYQGWFLASGVALTAGIALGTLGILSQKREKRRLHLSGLWHRQGSCVSARLTF